MKLYSSESLASLQERPERIRNICIIAHVDHGKTSLADALLVSNGIISRRMCGKIRYLDSRQDEQERGITMKSSSIALGHTYNSDEYLVNLIDSPGHVDFSGEVCTAVRLSDGAVVVVDVIEGICSQTKATLRQAWNERIKPILVLNKMDRLVLEKKLSPLDAYVYLQQLLEQINAFVGELFTTDAFRECQESTADAAAGGDSSGEGAQLGHDWHIGLDDLDDSNLYFQPEKDNVLFASAIDGWAFSVASFSRCLARKLGISERALNQTLWGDYFINVKQKKILKGAQQRAKKNLFVSLVLENVWAVYDSVLVRKDEIATEKIIRSLDLQLTRRDLNTTDARVRLQAIFAQWLPLSDNVLNCVCKLLPSPADLNDERIERLMCSNMTRFDALPAETQRLKSAFQRCASGADVVRIACVSKMFAVDRESLPESRIRPMTVEEIASRRVALKAAASPAETCAAPSDVPNGTVADQPETVEPVVESKAVANNSDEKNCFIAFARVFSGRLKKGDKIYVLGPKHDPRKLPAGFDCSAAGSLAELSGDRHITRATVEGLYMLMGRELEPLEQAVAGNIVGIRGLEQHVLKTATLSDSPHCVPFVDLNSGSSLPILRVAIEPQNPAEMPQLIRGLKLLNQADPCVEVRLQNSGEHVIVTTGEVHLQRCVDDLDQRFAGVRLNVSDPIVPFKETVIRPPKIDMVNERLAGQQPAKTTKQPTSRSVELQTPNKRSSVEFEALPLPETVVQLLEQKQELLKLASNVYSGKLDQQLPDGFREDMSKLKTDLTAAFKNDSSGSWPDEIVDRVWSVGPNHCGPNMLVNLVHDAPAASRSLWKSGSPSAPAEAAGEPSAEELGRLNYDTSFISGFQLASQAGPLCEEPMLGVCFLVRQWRMDQALAAGNENDPYGPFSGQIMSTVKDACRRAFQAQPQRLLSPMFSCNIQVSSDVLGKMYGVIARRHGRIISEEMLEGSQTFQVNALLPVIESFQFANEIRKQTSGMAVPQLLFSHWEVIDVDPFWVPTTEEEYLHFGEKSDVENRAKKYVDAVRKRKGLHVDEKIVEFAEKQRTLSKNK